MASQNKHEIKSDESDNKNPDRLNEIAEFRERSGKVNSTDPLTNLFYILIRDYMTAGDVEELVKDVTKVTDMCQFTNGWIAKYAQDLAIRVYGAGENAFGIRIK